MDDTRRTICKVAGLAVVGSVLPAACGGGVATAGLVNAGKASAVMLDDLVEIRTTGHNVNVCRDAGGLYAMSANCTHARCVLVFQPQNPPDMPLGFVCTCHGSTFDYNGEHQTAPAPSPLDHYKLIVDSTGTMFVDTGTIVPAANRTQG